MNGFVTNPSLDVGDYATPGKPVVALIDSDSYRVDARNYNTDIHRQRFVGPRDCNRSWVVGPARRR